MSNSLLKALLLPINTQLLPLLLTTTTKKGPWSFHGLKFAMLLSCVFEGPCPEIT